MNQPKPLWFHLLTTTTFSSRLGTQEPAQRTSAWTLWCHRGRSSDGESSRCHATVTCGGETIKNRKIWQRSTRSPDPLKNQSISLPLYSGAIQTNQKPGRTIQKINCWTRCRWGNGSATISHNKDQSLDKNLLYGSVLLWWTRPPGWSCWRCWGNLHFSWPSALRSLLTFPDGWWEHGEQHRGVQNGSVIVPEHSRTKPAEPWNVTGEQGKFTVLSWRRQDRPAAGWFSIRFPWTGDERNVAQVFGCSCCKCFYEVEWPWWPWRSNNPS